MTDYLKLAKSLRLTEKQRRFAEALALDPERNQTRAARPVSASERQATVNGARWMTLDKVQRYITAFTAVVPADVRESVRPRIADRNEVLRRLTCQARADIGQHLVIGENGVARVAIDPKRTSIIRGLKIKAGPTDPETGQAMWTETDIRVADPVVPLQALARIYGMENEKEGGNVYVNVERLLNVTAPRSLREISRLALKGGLSGGNGHQSDPA